MRKEDKLDAYMCLKYLRNGSTANSHMSLHHLMEYAVSREKITEEEALNFEIMFDKIMAMHMQLSREIYEDDE